MTKLSVSWINPDTLKKVPRRKNKAAPAPAPPQPEPEAKARPGEPIRYGQPTASTPVVKDSRDLQVRVDALKRDYDQLRASSRALEERERNAKEQALSQVSALQARVTELETKAGEDVLAEREASARSQKKMEKEIQKLQKALKEAQERISLELPSLKHTLQETRERAEQNKAELEGRLNEERVAHAGEIHDLKSKQQQRRQSAGQEQEKARTYKTRAEDAERREEKLSAELAELRDNFDDKLREMAATGNPSEDVAAVRLELARTKAKLAQATSTQGTVHRLSDEVDHTKARLQEVRDEATRLREALRSVTEGTREKASALQEKLTAAEKEFARGAS